jgi:Rrf2 family transcriptional regulator, nitric oxide-sensitive transcriptional repressor
MRLAEYTDYTLRVLMYCAARPDQRVTISELAEHHGVSRNHLMKIVTDLGRQGVLETTRGRGGGLRLLKHPAEIRVGDVVRASETDFRLVECFDPRSNACNLSPTCRLKSLFHAALRAYFDELDGMTLADIVEPLPLPAPAAGRAAPPRRRVPITPVAAAGNRRKSPRAGGSGG